MSPILTISRAIKIDGHLTLLSAPFNRRGQVIGGVGLNPQAPGWHEDFRRVTRLFAECSSIVELPGAALRETAPDSVAWQIAEHLAQMEHAYSAAAIDAYRAMDAAQTAMPAEGDGHATL
ncbi:hypothetical protein [Niveispirillum sp.]|uniref:hypothetical protein n=1 Tax=Niveispirillum sp. TaxID=1917217 RepID=UPI001B491B3D|nr:hypothetical protein [Niveispirillum sp.]MBP7338821.1 hypothetical protein [Niveispirillum sp.]